MFKVNQLRLLRELRQRGTMMAVGDAVGLTASAVSQQLGALESAAGARLLERIGRRVMLTEEGVRLATHADRVLGAMETAEQDFRSNGKVSRGDLVVATFASFANLRLLPAVIRARQRHPQLRITIQELESPDGIEAVHEGRCHMAIAFAYSLVPHPSDPHLLSSPLMEERMVLVLPAKGPKQRTTVDLRQLADADWVVGSRQSDDRLLLERICAVAGFVPRICHMVDDYSLVLKMAAAGLGIGFVPEMVLQGTRGVISRSVIGPQARRRIYAVTRPSMAENANVNALLAELRN